MCDTLVAVGAATADGATLFGKNSDREPNEAHHLVRIPAARHAPGSMVRCTHREIPQAGETYEVFLAKPFWIWGAEMGANEHGVTIGNEAVFTKVPYDKGPGLTGMDLLRLGLERARSARAALEVITSLLDSHGQGGNCGFQRRSYYHNSFIIADPHEAWVLETAGREWAAERVEGIRTISNGITIGGRWDLASDNLVAYAVERGWCRGRRDFHFGRCYSDPIRTRLNCCRERQARTTAILEAERGRITVATAMRALRDHGSTAGLDWDPAPGLAKATVCWHAGFGPVRAYQTTGSMVSHLGPGVQTHYATGSAAPCTGVFKPVWLGADWPDMGPVPAGTYDAAAIFWRHEDLHRAVLRDYAASLALYRQERDDLEHRFVEGAQARQAHAPAAKTVYMAACFAEASAAEERWLERLMARAIPPRQGPLYAAAWRDFDRRAGRRT